MSQGVLPRQLHLWTDKDALPGHTEVSLKFLLFTKLYMSFAPGELMNSAGVFARLLFGLSGYIYPPGLKSHGFWDTQDLRSLQSF